MLHLLAQTSSDADAAVGLLAGGMMMMTMLISLVISYVIAGIILSTLAKKLGATEHATWAWIPILQLMLFAELADQQGWMGLLCLVPYIGFAMMIFLFWKVCEKRGKPGWISLLLLVPCVNIIVPFYIAFAD